MADQYVNNIYSTAGSSRSMSASFHYKVSEGLPYIYDGDYHDALGCSIAKKMAFTTPQSLYQTQKIIQKTVRIPCSLYMDNLAALNVYQKPVEKDGVNWNQMSDRALASVSKATASSHGSSTKGTITRHRPGAGTPGGVGVDVKHNSYERRLLRLKGKGPFRSEPIPDNFGKPIAFSRAAPIYGGKVMKMNIVDGCLC
jgi:hypothetical protein